MKETGLLMTPENYGKCEDGTKWMTRRIIKPQPWEVIPPKAGEPPWPHGFRFKDGSTTYGDPFLMACPFGTVGDRLYVKEAHAIMSIEGSTVGVAYKNRLPKGKTLADTDGGLNLFLLGEEEVKWAHEKQDCERWRSPLFMPMIFARLWLELTEVRVERLQEISEADARAEGCQVPEIIYPDSPREAYSYVEQFKLLWESNKIHKPGSWDLNPWVWVLSFKKVAK